MTCKVSLTTRCNATCATCPVWQHKGQDMSYEVWREVWRRLNASPDVSKIILNNTGDVGVHPDRALLFDVMRTGKRKFLVMQTNGAHLPDLPPGLDHLVISFNGGTKKSYEATTGLDFDLVVGNIKRLYPAIQALSCAEIHCLVYDGNAGTEEALGDLWADFPGRVRLSYKYDNQHAEDRTLPQHRETQRVMCDYLSQLCIWPDGSVIMCAHDFKGENRWGSILTNTPAELMAHPLRQKKNVEHYCDEYTGLCADCNYNTLIGDRIRYLR